MVFIPQKPAAVALLNGNSMNQEISGIVNFYRTSNNGLLISTEVQGLPKSYGFLGFHIHDFGDCTPPFDQTGTHYNPTKEMHPHHLGDLPSLFNSNGYAYLSFYNNMLSIEEIAGRSIIIHSNRDDFTSQPSGDSGVKIACGIIQPL